MLQICSLRLSKTSHSEVTGLAGGKAGEGTWGNLVLVRCLV